MTTPQSPAPVSRRSQAKAEPLEPAVLESLVDAAVKLDRQIKDDTRRLRDLKAQLMVEASLHPADHGTTEGGGSSWTFTGRSGNIVRVIFPAPQLRSSFDPENKTHAKILAKFGDLLGKLFGKRVVYKPLDDFRARVEMELPPARAAKLIAACETESDPKVTFETAESLEAK
jgi:hypothetical protein